MELYNQLSNVQDNKICSTLISGNEMELYNQLSNVQDNNICSTLMSGNVMKLDNYLTYRTTRYVLH